MSTRLLAAARDVKTLVTSRAPLHLSGEHEFRGAAARVAGTEARSTLRAADPVRCSAAVHRAGAGGARGFSW